MTEPVEQHSHLHHVDELTAEPPPRFSRKRVGTDDELDITPMIDITFLLLIFFLVASHMDAQAGVTLPPARYGAAVPVQESVILTVDEGPDAVARVFRGDGAIAENEFSMSNLVQQEAAIIQYVEQEMQSGVPRKHHVLIKAAARLKHREVARVARVIGQVDQVKEVHIAVLETE